MKKELIAIIVLLIVAAAGWSLYLITNTKTAELENAEAARIAQEERLDAALGQAADLTTRLEDLATREAESRAEAEKARQQAEEAQRMADAKARQAEFERLKKITELNEQLALEAAERRVASERAFALADRLAKVEEAQALAQKRQEEIMASSPEPIEDLTDALKILKEKQAELDSLRREQERLLEISRTAIERQYQTQQEILDLGGNITGIDQSEQVSAYDRRRMQLELKAMGTPERATR